MLSHTSAILIALASTMQSQRVQSGISVVGGTATDVVGVTSRALTVAPSVSLLPDPRVAIGLEAAGTRFDQGQWSLAGGVASALRLPVNRFATLGLDASGALTTTSYEVSYQTASALPFVETGAGPVSAYAGARGTFAAVSAEQTTTSGVGGLFGGVPTTNRSRIQTSRSSRAFVYGVNGRITNNASETMRIGAREERGTVDTIPTIDRSVSLSVERGRMTIGGNVGVRSERALRGTFGSGSMSVAVTQAAAIEINAGAYPANRLVGSAPGRFFNIGLSLRSGRVASAPVPKGVPSVPAGYTRVTYRDKKAQRVELFGDFTNWKPVAATRAENGVWYADLRLPPGEYRYAFRVDGNTWRVPEGVVAFDDDFGGKSARLVVAAPSSSAR